MSLTPEPRTVIRYDFRWKLEESGQQKNADRDRPCVIVNVSRDLGNGTRRVWVSPITHTPPGDQDRAIPVPQAIAKRLGLDDTPSWIKTNQVNVLAWYAQELPAGLSKTPTGEWSYGQMPRELTKQAQTQVQAHRRDGTLQKAKRESYVQRALDRQDAIRSREAQSQHTQQSHSKRHGRAQ